MGIFFFYCQLWLLSERLPVIGFLRHRDATPNKSRASEVGDKALECGRRLFLLRCGFFSRCAAALHGSFSVVSFVISGPGIM